MAQNECVAMLKQAIASKMYKSYVKNNVKRSINC